MRTPKRKWIITGTERTIGGWCLDHSFEWAVTKREAWQQALNHAAGTRFTPEIVEAEGAVRPSVGTFWRGNCLDEEWEVIAVVDFMGKNYPDTAVVLYTAGNVTFKTITLEWFNKRWTPIITKRQREYREEFITLESEA